MATAGTPLATTQGLIPSIIERGNLYNYSSVTGMTIADFESLNLTLDSQKGAKNNVLFTGIALDQQIDRELRDQFKNGGINYGMFTMNEDKKVNLGFTSFKIGQYEYMKKQLDAFSDLQTLGASGFNFKYEAILMPGEKIADGNGAKVAPISIRHLEGKSGSREMRVEAVDLFKTGSSGEDAFEMRYISEMGLEVPGANRMAYIKLV